MDIQKEKPAEKQIEIQISDIISAHRIMEYAIGKNLFTTKELVDVAPVVTRFQEFVEQVQRVQAEQQSLADDVELSNESQDQDGSE